MNLAIEQAKIAFDENEIPIGAIVVIDDRVVGVGHNKRENIFDITSHAEINAIKDAQKNLNLKTLEGATLYTTVEPCLMCTGAIIQARIKKVYYGANEPNYGSHVSKYVILGNQAYGHKIEVYDGILEEECSKLLKDFFKNKR